MRVKHRRGPEGQGSRGTARTARKGSDRHGRHGHGEQRLSGMWRGAASSGAAVSDRLGVASLGVEGEARQPRPEGARLGQERPGPARQSRPGEEWADRRGKVWIGVAVTAGSRTVVARRRVAVMAWRGCDRLGQDRLGPAVLEGVAFRVQACTGTDRSGVERRGRLGVTRRGRSWKGIAGRGTAVEARISVAERG